MYCVEVYSLVLTCGLKKTLKLNLTLPSHEQLQLMPAKGEQSLRVQVFRGSPRPDAAGCPGRDPGG